MEPDEYLDTLRRDSRLLVAAVRRADPAAAVAACPGWTPADLAWHIGEVHWFWASIVRDRITPDAYAEPERPPTDEGVFDFADESARLLEEALATADPQTPVWTWSEPHNAGFVIRRMALETAVHRVDAERAAGGDHRIDPELAADGIDEFLTHFLRWVADDAAPLGGSVHFHCADASGEWTLTIDADGGTTVVREHSKGDVALRGDAHDLLMVLWRRAPLDSVEVLGDHGVAERFISRTDLS
jgi:uncharacterized protein (TIGR03083 family)